ncbi:MAG: hypothetical protein LBK53_06195 [Heliobacteriaceae bacterium]|jgi:hypothetical protein|nr:hypothetical protein [Heliobacteriaceae bacterium]
MRINPIPYSYTLTSPEGKNRAELRTPEGYKSSGSLTKKSGAAAVSFNGLFKNIASGNWYNSILTYTSEHNVSASALVSLVFASILRPVTIMGMPGKEGKNSREDKIYASGHSIASGLIGFVSSVILTSPLDIAIKKIKESKNPAADYGLKEYSKLTPKMQRSLNNVVRMLPDWIIAVPRAALTVALIPPILKYVFGIEKKKQAAPVVNNIIPIKSVFQDFKGGLRT